MAAKKIRMVIVLCGTFNYSYLFSMEQEEKKDENMLSLMVTADEDTSALTAVAMGDLPIMHDTYLLKQLIVWNGKTKLAILCMDFARATGEPFTYNSNELVASFNAEENVISLHNQEDYHKIPFNTFLNVISNETDDIINSIASLKLDVDQALFEIDCAAKINNLMNGDTHPKEKLYNDGSAVMAAATCLIS